MRHQIGLILCGVLLSGGVVCSAPTAYADQPRSGEAVGIVTTLSGRVMVTSEAMPQLSLPLKFKDEVFRYDRISTKELSMARVLLRGKSLVTVRELSDLTITEDPGRPSFINLLGGKISLAVAKLRMRPGESIEVRTPNAIAAVRGTVLVVEVTPLLGKAANLPDGLPRHAILTGDESGVPSVVAEAPEFVTTLHVLKGNVDVFDLAGNLQGNLQAGFNMTVVGAAFGKPSPNPPLLQVIGDLKSGPQITDPPTQAIETLQLNQTADLKVAEGGVTIPFVPNTTTSPALNVVTPTTGFNFSVVNPVSSGGGTRIDHGE